MCVRKCAMSVRVCVCVRMCVCEVRIWCVGEVNALGEGVCVWRVRECVE